MKKEDNEAYIKKTFPKYYEAIRKKKEEIVATTQVKTNDLEIGLNEFNKKIEEKFIPNGEDDLMAGSLETKNIFPHLSLEEARSLFIKTLFKFTFSGVPDDESFKEKLEASNLHNSTQGQRERYREYFLFVILACNFNKSPKDIIFLNGAYSVKKDTPFFKKYNWKIVVASILVIIFGVSIYNLSFDSSKNNSLRSQSAERSLEVGNAGNFDSEEPPVKKSSTGICHPQGGTYYDKTKNFTPFGSIDECLESGGRMPKK